MRTNSSITVWNKYRVSNVDTYQRTQILDVAWEQRHARNQFDRDDLATVYVPMERGADYLKPHDWQALTSKAGKWTLQVGDIVVKGLVSDELTPTFSLSALKAKYDDCLIIASVDTFDFGSANLQHWRVGAK